MNKTDIAEIEKQEITPVQMIMAAVSGQADLDKVEKLLLLQERYEANEARKAYHKAMAEFKSNPPKIEKDKKVAFGNTKYNHASLYNVVEKITKELSKHGLSASWLTSQNGHITVTCRITHVLGHSEETPLSADADKSGAKNDIQALGSTISYLERYTLLAALGLATVEQDNDGKTVTDKITAVQLKTLDDLIKTKELDKSLLLTYLEIESLDALPTNQYMKALTAINAAKKVVK